MNRNKYAIQVARERPEFQGKGLILPAFLTNYNSPDSYLLKKD